MIILLCCSRHRVAEVLHAHDAAKPLLEQGGAGVREVRSDGLGQRGHRRGKRVAHARADRRAALGGVDKVAGAFEQPLARSPEITRGHPRSIPRDHPRSPEITRDYPRLGRRGVRSRSPSGRYGEIWGDMGRYGEERGEDHRLRGAVQLGVGRGSGLGLGLGFGFGFRLGLGFGCRVRV